MSYDKGSIERLIFQTIGLMSREVSARKGEEYRREIACLDKSYAELIVYCHAYKEFFPDDKDFIDFLESKAIPLLKRLGMVHFQCDVLTELGFKLGPSDKGFSFGKKRVTEEEEPDYGDSEQF